MEAMAHHRWPPTTKKNRGTYMLEQVRVIVSVTVSKDTGRGYHPKVLQSL